MGLGELSQTGRNLLAESGSTQSNINQTGLLSILKLDWLPKGILRATASIILRHAPVAWMGTVRILLSIAVHKSCPLHQLDVKNVFLHGDLAEEIYMDISLGYNQSRDLKRVCKLKKAQ